MGAAVPRRTGDCTQRHARGVAGCHVAHPGPNPSSHHAPRRVMAWQRAESPLPARRARCVADLRVLVVSALHCTLPKPDWVVQVARQGHARGLARGVVPVVQAGAQHVVSFDGAAQDRDRLVVEELAHRDAAVAAPGAAWFGVDEDPLIALCTMGTEGRVAWCAHAAATSGPATTAHWCAARRWSAPRRPAAWPASAVSLRPARRPVPSGPASCGRPG